MPEEKSQGKVAKIFSDHGEKIGLGVAAAILLGYLVFGVAMKEEFKEADKLEATIRAKDAELTKEHENRKAPEARDYTKDIAYWNTVATASGAPDFGGTLLPSFNGIAVKPKEIVKLAVKVPSIRFVGTTVELNGITVAWSADEFTRTELKKWSNPRSKERFDVFNITGYTLERMVGESGEWKELAKLEPAASKYKDVKIKPRTLYSYRITSHVEEDKQNRDGVKGMTVGTPAPVKTKGIWELSFANAMKGMAYVTITKFEQDIGEMVSIKHIHHAGDKIGWWKERGSEEPVSKHGVPDPREGRRGQRYVPDWNSGMVLKSVEPTKIKVGFKRCIPKFDKAVGAKIGCDIKDMSALISTNEIQYMDEEGKLQKIHSPDPTLNPRAADQKCEAHGGTPRRRTTAKAPKEGEKEAVPDGAAAAAAAEAKHREETAAKMFADAEKLEARGTTKRAIGLYEQLLKEFASTKFVSQQKKTIIEERLVRLRRSN